MVDYKKLNRFIEQILTGSESLEYISRTLMEKSFGFQEAIAKVEIFYNGRFYLGFYVDMDDQSECVDIMLSEEYDDVHDEIISDMKAKNSVCFDVDFETFIDEDERHYVLKNSVIVLENDFKVTNNRLFYMQKQYLEN